MLLAISFCIGIAALGLCIMPFPTTAPDGSSAQCGPPLYEVVVPPDPAFDVIENSVCTAPARVRLVTGGSVLVAAVVVAITTQRRSRQGTLDRQAVWLAGKSQGTPRPRPAVDSPPGPALTSTPRTSLAGPAEDLS